MIVYIIRIGQDHPDAGRYWCGYKDKVHDWQTHGGKAIRFVTGKDALRAGVSAPNTPYKDHTEFKNNGVEIWGFDTYDGTLKLVEIMHE